ncbi:MAG: SGNH/GDSL hydrolase family protein [Candidatus Omnitrophica bacterium]|nr:SGNH/GDSL hydrolase family protein [Candidatus Omnitrophota bacterium]
MKMKKNLKVILILIALLPIFVHTILLGISVVKSDYRPFGKFDLIIFAVVLVYLFCVIFVRNNREHLIRLILIAYAFILAVLLCEAFLNFVYNPDSYMPLRPKHRVTSAEENVMPGISGRIEYSVNRFGVRGPEVKLDEADIRILAIGGSTVECLYVTDKLSWPWRLQDKLSERLGKNVFVGNAGISGHFTLDHIYLLRNYRYVEEFDYIILMSGMNDMGTFLRKNYNDRAQAFLGKGASGSSVYYRNMKLYKVCRKIFNRYFILETVVQDPWGRWHEARRQKRRKALENHTIRQVPAGLKKAIWIYRNNLRKIINICKDRKQNLLMVTQPSMYRKDLPPGLEKLLWEYVSEEEAYTAEVLEKILEAYNTATIGVCGEEEIPCIDLASMLPKDTSVFYDDCHFNISGCEIISEILAEELVELRKKSR